MGYYIETPSSHNKAQFLIDNHAAVRTDLHGAEKAYQDGLGVVCVVNNGPFEAAGYIYSERELRDFTPGHGDTRPRTWLIMDKQVAERLSRYTGH